jgi:AacA4 family aminoglycoside N(6')-acetyltransferase
MLPAAPLSLRLMTEADIPLLHTWLQRPHVQQWWLGDEGEPTLDQAHARYLPRVRGEEPVTPYIVMLDGRPVGFAQSYVALGSGDGWWENETDPGVRGIDQFLAEEQLLGRGIGTRLVRTLVARLFADAAVTKVQTDPHPANARAIRCYEKAGFRRIGEIVTPDGAALYMLQDRPPAMNEESSR